jgi:hypothetical protein
VAIGVRRRERTLAVRPARACDAKTRRPLPIAEADPLVVAEIICDVRSLAA